MRVKAEVAQAKKVYLQRIPGRRGRSAQSHAGQGESSQLACIRLIGGPHGKGV